MPNGKVMVILLIVGEIKNTLHKMSQYFPKPHIHFGRNVEVQLNLHSQKNATILDIFKLTAKSDLASLKAEVDKKNIDKLKTVPVDLSKLSVIVNNNVV